MAGNQINVGINVSSNGTTDTETKKAKGLKDMLDQAALSAGKAGKAMAASGGAVTSQQVMEYGRARAAGPGTGASARDFANQAQGLGGLVRLYATYAANVFAVGAAFRALSEAMQTTTMISGLNQLGAASGTAMGTLAKRFEEASGGAISLRDSMQATAKAITSGLSPQQFLKLGDVAKKASQTLGIDMGDAVSRLTRGITKLEPELLDELGLFTKIGPATEQYALKVGKSVSSLTDFEKRQAFANAVLEEGINKFGQIDLPTNPYEKLSASLKNLTQQILEVVNKALGPLIDSLSTSPKALGVGIAALGVTLVKQALPALGEYRRELQQSATLATQRAQVKAQEANEARLQAFGAAIKKADQDAQDAADRADSTMTKVEKTIKSSRSRIAESVKPIVSKQNILEVTPQELKVLDDLGAKNTKLGATYRALAADIRAAQTENDNYNKAVKAQEVARAQQPSPLSAAGRAQTIAKRAQDIATQQQIISQAGYAGSVLSVRQGFDEMFKSIKESDMGPIRKGFTGIAGSLSLITTAATSVISAFQGWIFIAGAVVAGFQLLDGLLSKNKEELNKFNTALEDSKTAVTTYSSTLDYFAKNQGKAFTTAGLTAYANAVTGLTSSISKLSDEFIQLEKKTRGWDSFTESVARFFGGGQTRAFAEQTSDSLKAIVASVDDVAKRSDLEQKISKALGVSGRDSWAAAIVNGGAASARALKELAPELDKVSNELNNTSSRATEFDNSFKQLTDSYKKFTKDVKDDSPYTQLGNSLLNFSTKLAGAMTDPNVGLQKFIDLLKDTETLQLVSPDQLNSLTALRSRMASLGDTSTKVNESLRSARLKEAELRSQAERDVAKQRFSEQLTPQQRTSQINSILKSSTEYQKVQLLIDELTQSQVYLAQKTEELMKDPTFGKIILDGFVKGAGIVGREIQTAATKSKIELGRNVLSLIPDLQGKAAIEGTLKQQELDLMKTDLELKRNSIQAQNALTLAIVANTAAQRVKTAQEMPGAPGGDTGVKATPQEIQASKVQEKALALSLLTKDVMEFATKKNSKLTAESLQKRVVSLSDPTDIENFSALNSLLAVINSASKSTADLLNIANQERLNIYQTQNKVFQETQKADQQTYEAAQALNKARQQELDFAISLQDIADSRLLQQKEELQIASATLAREYQKTNAQKIYNQSLQDINHFKNTGAITDEKALETLRSSAATIRDQAILTADLKFAEEEKNIIKERLKDNETRITKELEKQRKEIENRLALEKLNLEISEANANKEKVRLDILKSIDSLSKADVQRRQNTRDLLDFELSSQQKIKALEDDRRKALEPLQEKAEKASGTVAVLSIRGEQDPTILSAANAERAKADSLVKATNENYDERLRILREILGIDKESLLIKQRDALLVAKYEDQQRKVTEDRETYSIISQGQEMVLDLSRQRLDIERENGTISEDNYNQAIRGLEIERRERDLNNKQLEIANKYQDQRNKLELDFQRALKAAPGGVLSEEDAQDFEDRRTRLTRNQDLELGNLQQLREGYAVTDAARRDLSTREKGYQDLLQNSFYKSSDAIADWLNSGEKSFNSFKRMTKDLVTSVLQDILKLELKLQAQDMWIAFRRNMMGASGGNFLNGLLQSISGGKLGTAPFTEYWNPVGFVGPQAKGGVFEDMKYFSKGGMFTNSIVDNPTIFKFAKGVGMMGEAGPEAIMPLKRDSSGNLGVRADGSKTEVVVNNYTTERAEARETVDSRGNRRVEVTIGDMAASEITRSGSSSQRAVSGTFGLKPQLIRR